MQKETPVLSAKALSDLGIIKKSFDIFHVGEHQYSNIEHAVAEARRAIAKKQASDKA
ncbi:hypothetical protein N8835_06890 [Alphaproteobacteria bacterium]|nr:hypothetical protein [Alphaproteobacteria bacterium]